MSVRVSGLVAVYNGEAYIAEAIDSMLGELGQEDELIVVDDGSTDATPEILERYSERIVWASQRNAGSAAALNRAISMSNGRYLAFNDADDLWQPGRIALMTDLLDSDSTVDIVTGLSQQFVSPELSDEAKVRFAPPVELMKGEIIPCMVMRRATYDRVGAFDALMRVTFGYSWILRGKELGVITAILPEIVSRRRLHPNNWSRLNRDELKAHSLRAMHEHLTRRRRESGTT